MSTAVPAGDLERRKRLRIRIRPDLNIEPHQYEGRTFYVVKDPVSLRYYRLKDNEHFLLRFLDGGHTLEDAQKAYEKEYRPERLKLEDLEGFAQQLLTAGPGAERVASRRQAALRAPRQAPPQRMDADAHQHPLHQDPDLRSGMDLEADAGAIWAGSSRCGSSPSAWCSCSAPSCWWRRTSTRSAAKLPNYHEFFSFKTASTCGSRWAW